MNVRPAILCPIDYSDASGAALRYAAALAEHFVARLVVVTVEDPLLTDALEIGTRVHWTPEASTCELSKFAAETLADDRGTLGLCEYEVAVGKPPVEILRVARERRCDLIVMSSHGITGVRKLFFGSTTERVLRETTVPVLVTPPANPGRIRLEDARRLLGRIVVPVDLSPASLHQTQVARGVAEALALPLVLLHVLEPVRSRILARTNLASLDAGRRAEADECLGELMAAIPPEIRAEALIVFGDPAEEAAKVVRDRHAGLVVMGLHGMPPVGPRMGSVTYRMLCLTPTLVLALPPKWAEPAHRATARVVAASGSDRGHDQGIGRIA